jgi:CDP-glycerol glycerophosphotransferase (TagB/SpsB family)
MIQLAKHYIDRMQIIFKPHPNLKSKLYKHDRWGIRRTDEYYEVWNGIENRRLEEGEYISLFNESDAMIFDSVSFLSEYTCTGKPSLFLKRRENIFEENMNELGKEVAKSVYKGSTKEEITDFIDEVVLFGNDYLLSERKKIINEVLFPPSNRTATENIYYHLLSELTG